MGSSNDCSWPFHVNSIKRPGYPLSVRVRFRLGISIRSRVAAGRRRVVDDRTRSSSYGIVEARKAVVVCILNAKVCEGAPLHPELEEG